MSKWRKMEDLRLVRRRIDADATRRRGKKRKGVGLHCFAESSVMEDVGWECEFCGDDLSQV